MIMTTNISRIILSQTINYLNLHEYAKFDYMRKFHIIPLIVAVMVLSGCDFMRKLAGRPTSDDIEYKRVELLRAEEAALQARLDSLRKVEEKMLQDSLNALDSIRQLGGSILNPAALGGLFATKLESRYYIILGSFRTRSNAESLFNVARNAGYRPALISFGRGGLIAVGVSPVNKLQDALSALNEVKKEKFCPSDVWILVNE